MKRNRELLWLVIGACALGILLARGLLLEPGWIGLRHDWTPWAFANELVALARSEFYGFSQTGLGTPVAYPNDWIIYLPYALASLVLNSEVISKATLVLVPSVSAAGTYVLTRRVLGYSFVAAGVSAVFAACSPVMYNRIVAGQLGFLWALALLPWWLAVYRSCEARSRQGLVFLLCTGLSAAAISAQLQFILFLGILIVCDLVLWRRRSFGSSTLAAAATAAGVVVAQAGTIITLAAGYRALETGNNIPALSWVQSNSASLWQALQLRGYVAHYFELGYSVSPLRNDMALLGSIFLVVILIGISASVRTSSGRFFVAIWMLGVILSLGLNGPVGQMLVPLYEKYRPMQLFREIYHWSTLSNLASCIFLGAAAEATLRLKLPARAALSTCVVLSIVYCYPSLDGEWGGNVQTVRLTRELSATYTRLGSGSDLSRILWLPADQPISLYDGSFAGIDPMAYARPPALWAYVPTAPLTSMVMNLRTSRERGLEQLLQYTGVEDIVDRRELRSQLPSFFFRSYPSMQSAYSRNANLQGLAKLNWPAIYVGNDVAVFRAPRPNFLLTYATGRAFISASEDFLDDLPAGVSPDASPSSPVRATVVSLEASDIDSSIAALGGGRDGLRRLSTLATDDARKGWAPFQEWWPYREIYTRVFDGSVISFSPGATLSVAGARPGDLLVLSYVASQHGGAMLVRCGNVSHHVNTLSTARHVALLKADVISINGQCPVEVVNVKGEQLLRHVYLLDRASWRQGKRRLIEMERGAQALRFAVHGSAPLPVGRPGVYRVLGAARVDGREVANARIALTSGVHHVDASGACLESGALHLYVSQTPSSVTSAYNGTMFTGFIAPGARMLVLRSLFSDGWQLRINGNVIRDHGIGDLYGNLWRLPPSKRALHFQLVYLPAQFLSRCHYASALILSLAILATAFLAVPHGQAQRAARATTNSSPPV